MVQHVGACSRAFLCGVCMFSPCYPGSPRRTPTIKTCKKSRCSSVLSLTKTGPSTWTWSPGRRIAGRPLLLAVPGAGCQDGLKAENTVITCMCVCVCVCCRVALKRACPPDFISNSTGRVCHQHWQVRGIQYLYDTYVPRPTASKSLYSSCLTLATLPQLVTRSMYIQYLMLVLNHALCFILDYGAMPRYVLFCTCLNTLNW